MSLVVRAMELRAIEIKHRLRHPTNAVPDLGIDLKRKVIPISNADSQQSIPVAPLEAFGPKIVDLDEEAFGPIVLPPVRGYRIEEIQRAVSAKYQVPRIEIISHRRTANIVRPRQVGMYLSKILTTKSLPEIGRRFGKKDHTTVLHAVRKIEAKRKIDAQLDAEICDLIKTITA